MKFRTLKLVLPAACALAIPFQSNALHYNHLGYESIGPKSFVVESSSPITRTSFDIVDTHGNSAYSGTLENNVSVDEWPGRYFRKGIFSDLCEPGIYHIECGGEQSAEFRIRDNVLFETTAQANVDFFRGMRNTFDDRSVPFFNDNASPRDVHGGWNDATGDMGKYLSHLAFSNYMTPQQIPMVVWSLLRSWELNKNDFDNSILSEAAYGADYLLRILDPDGYFYMIIFDRWGWDINREICTWKYNPDPSIPEYNWSGFKTNDWHAAFREGGGMAIAALAKAAALEIDGEYSSDDYLVGAEKAYAHLKDNNLSYCDNGEENIIDDYCALMAATELYKATGDGSYKIDARGRADNLVARLSDEGWFRSDSQGRRPYYHAAEEGLPVIALIEFLTIDTSKKDAIHALLQKSIDWYLKITHESANPFNYVKLQYAHYNGSTGSGNNLAAGKPSEASSSQLPNLPQNAFDSDAVNSRWSSGEPFDSPDYSAWLQVDLESACEIQTVILRWEAAYGTEYRVQLSTDGTTWDDTYHETAGDGGVDIITIDPPRQARYVRMYGRQKSYLWGGYSLYEFEVYGEFTGAVEFTTSFFQPHVNETGYWWQGENARIASLSAAFMSSARALDSSFQISITDSVSDLALSQFNWILGGNPFDVCMMYGFGNNNYPHYAGKPGYAISNVEGGICNGITSDTMGGGDIAWMPWEESNSENWRWVEQWLPHNAWYLLAVSTLNHILNTAPLAAQHGKPVAFFGSGMAIHSNDNGHLVLDPAGDHIRQNGTITVHDTRGRLVLRQTADGEKTSLSLAGHSKGLYVISYTASKQKTIRKTYNYNH
ncbi:MAG: hypothetical protein GF401_16035 [Chitinivibrionales bacterium]|nr:hypothetical protein [Chitinivibrionales bacterium]